MASIPEILITGFKPFPGAPENPTERLIELIEKQGLGVEGVEVTALVLPAEYHFVEYQLADLFDVHKPDIALHFGLSQAARGFTLEKYAHNQLNTGRVDGAGIAPNKSVIDAQGPQRITSGLPLGEIERALKAESLPVALSENAGGYVCNHVFYRARQLATQGKCQMSGFIHVPLLDTQTEDEQLATLTESQLLAGVRGCVVACVKHWRINKTSV